MVKKKQQDEFYIMMENTPVYDRSKPYYEQTPEVIEFFENEKRKIMNGVTIDGVFIHPWMYWHINYFKTPIPMPKRDEDGNIIYKKNGKPEQVEKLMNPSLDDNFWYFLENYKRAALEDKGLCIFGTRGYSKSTIITSLATFLNTTKENGTLEIVGGDDSDLNAISRLMDIGFNKVHPSFLLPRNTSNWKSHIEFGLKTKGRTKIPYSDIFIKNAAKGTDKKTEKGAGGSPIGFVVDEIGKFNFLGIYNSALPAFETQYGFKCVPILSGTGGNMTLSKDAKAVLKKPKDYKMLEMDWDLLNSLCPEEHRTWKEKTFGVFAPGQMSYRMAVPKIKTNLADFLKVESEYLSKVDMYVTDWKAAKEFHLSRREELKKNEDSLNKHRMYYPLDTDECFLEEVINPFPTKVIRNHLDKIEQEGDIGMPMEVFRSSGEWVTTNFSEKKRSEYPFAGGECDAPILIFNNHEIPKECPSSYYFVAGLDGYKVDTSKYTDSLGAFYVLQRRNVEGNSPCEKIVCSYTARPPKMNDFHIECEKILEMYNAQCCMESIDTHFLQYLDMKSKAYDFLTPAVSFGAINSKRKASNNTKFGIYPNKANQDYMFALVVDYCLQSYDIDMDDEGNRQTKMGVEYIEDTELLREMMNYKKGGNYDRIIAFGHALAWSRELDKEGVMPDLSHMTNKKKDTPKKGSLKRIGFFGRRHRAF